MLEKIWADWEKFASYAFNKSHATCYSWVAYQTAFLKANYPAEYMAAVMSRSLSDITTITKLMDECKSMGIKVLGPDVNESNLKFTVNPEGNIRFGLGAVKGVGEGAVHSIMEEREKNGPYTGIFDFVQRVNLNSCNKKNLECLALAYATANQTQQGTCFLSTVYASVQNKTYSNFYYHQLFNETSIRNNAAVDAVKNLAYHIWMGDKYRLDFNGKELFGYEPKYTSGDYCVYENQYA